MHASLATSAPATQHYVDDSVTMGKVNSIPARPSTPSNFKTGFNVETVVSYMSSTHNVIFSRVFQYKNQKYFR